MTSELQRKIRSRGFWQVTIRPTVFNERLVPDIARLIGILEKVQVRFRGWYFPHIHGREARTIGADWIGEELDWDIHKSIWRFYQSGQFFQLSCMDYDWRDESTLWPAHKSWVPGAILSVEEVIFLSTEVLEFATRLSMSDAGAANMHVEVVAGNLRGRGLAMQDPLWDGFFAGYSFDLEQYQWEKTVSQSELVSRSKDLAIELSRELFQRARWLNVSEQTLREVQGELIRRSRR